MLTRARGFFVVVRGGGDSNHVVAPTASKNLTKLKQEFPEHFRRVDVGACTFARALRPLLLTWRANLLGAASSTSMRWTCSA